MTKQEILLAAEMLNIASEKFSNHGCNDLSKEAIALITNEDELCKSLREYNGGEPHPENIGNIGDSQLMDYLAEKLKELATDVKIKRIINQ